MGEELHVPQNTPICAPGVNGTKVTEPTKSFVLGLEESMGQCRVTTKNASYSYVFWSRVYKNPAIGSL